MIIIGDKVSIRRISIDDEAKFISAVQRSEKHLAPWVNPPSNKEDFSLFLERASQDNQESFLVVTKNTNDLVGVVNLNNIIRSCFQSSHLGYYSFTPYIKKGLMTEALSLIINFAFFNLQLHRIESNIQPGNISSINLVKRCGFIEEGYAKNYLKINGFWKDHIQFSITLEQAQLFWIKEAHDKTSPWLPDFEIKPEELKIFLLENCSVFKSINVPKLIDHGWDNDVYMLEEHNIIFRCPRRKVAATLIQRENTALDFLKNKLNLKIPDPTYKFIGPPNYPYPFHGYNFLDGEAVHKANLSDNNRSQNIYDFAKFLKTLHGIPLTEALDAGISPQVFDRTNANKISDQIMQRTNQTWFKKYNSLDVNKVSELSEEAKNITLDKSNLVIVHGDLYCKHLLFKEKKLTSIIDWGDVGLNHPVVDLASLYSIFPKFCHNEFYAIYGEIDEDIKKYAKFLALHSALACLDFALNHNDLYLEKESERTLKEIIGYN
ncbi:MAG: GNAT family N-acetyltransferase [Legionellaceae bacterium]|nr:GNAT family N-acetyltransferase [Legionellaceae bacterium]